MTLAAPIRTGLGVAEIGGAIIIAAGLMAGDGHAQTLSEALGEQLEGECGRLLGTDLASERLEGQLETICRSGLTFPFPTTELTGAEAALTGSASGQQQRLLRDVEEPEALAASTTGGAAASADTSLESIGIRLFASVGIESFDRDATRYQAGYDSDITTISGGVGYLLTAIPSLTAKPHTSV